MQIKGFSAGSRLFSLKPADGAIGAHQEAVHSCYQDFLQLARCIANKAGLVLN